MSRAIYLKFPELSCVLSSRLHSRESYHHFDYALAAMFRLWTSRIFMSFSCLYCMDFQTLSSVLYNMSYTTISKTGSTCCVSAFWEALKIHRATLLWITGSNSILNIETIHFLEQFEWQSYYIMVHDERYLFEYAQTLPGESF